jgi:SAM-dependent methyltransferase
MVSEPLDFSRRAELSEWMDEPCSYSEFRDCLHDLGQVNRVVLSYRPTLNWLEQFAGKSNRPVHIIDVGCGGGDMLRRIESWARSRRVAVRLTGIDLNPFAAQAAREFAGPNCQIEWITGNAFGYQRDGPIDVVVSSLFTHHLSDPEIVRFLQWMETVAERGWFINDLSRGRVSYSGFNALAWLMRWHPFVQHDGPVSIRRSFVPDDWRAYIRAAGINSNEASILSVWPGRLCVARVK